MAYPRVWPPLAKLWAISALTRLCGKRSMNGIKRKIRAIGILGVWAAMAGATALASSPSAFLIPQPGADQLKSMSLAQLGNIRVTTVSKQPEEVWHTPAAIYVITHKQIMESGARTIPDLLRMVPGVQVSQEQSDQWAVGIRGFDSPFSAGLLVLIDGRSVYTPLFEGVYWDVQDLPLDNIARIEIIRGPGGTIWGPNAVNGVINIITRAAGDTQGVRVRSDGGSAVEHFTGTVRDGFRPAPDVQARIWAKGFNRGPELNPGGDPYDAWHQERGGFRVDWEPSGRDHVAFAGMMYQGMSGEQIPRTTLTPPATVMLDGEQAVAGGDLWVRWDHDLGRNSDFYVQSYFDRTNRNTPQFAEGRNTFDVDATVHVGNLPRQDLILGAGLRESPNHFEQKLATVNIAPHEENAYLYSLFAQDEFTLVPKRLELTLGSKFEDNNFSGWGVEPSARILWNPRRDMTVWGAVTRALRIPGELDRGLSEMVLAQKKPVVFEQAVGNPNFQPVVMVGWEAGYRELLMPRLYVDVTSFYNQYDNVESYNGRGPTVSRPTQPYPYTLYSFEYANGLKGITDGVEIAPDWKVTNWWELRGSYSHLHMSLHSKPGFSQASYAANYEGFAPHQQTSVASVFGLPRHLTVTADYRYVSALPTDHISAYRTGDAWIGWKLSKRWEVSVTGRNLLQPSHREGPGDNGNLVGIRRTVFAGLQWTR